MLLRKCCKCDEQTTQCCSHTCSFGLGFILLVQAAGLVAASAVNFTQCLNTVVQNANATHNLTGLLNGEGQPVSTTDDTMAISYWLCASACGTGPESFQWFLFSQEFSSWLLPFLALISQLPFGAQYRLDNLMSAVLTIGSPVLAGYSLIITLLNSCWIHRRFKQSVNYPNANYAVSILSSLQQVPLKIHLGPPDFPSLVILPENDTWWRCFAEFVDYTHTWSISSATSIAWVVVAYILTVINSLSDVYSFVQSNGEATGSMWLWLIPIVVGWLQLSPKCDFNRLQEAYNRAERHGRAAVAAARMGQTSAITQRALTITAAEEDVMSPDELLTPPVFNYSRSLSWSSTAETTFLMFKRATEKSRSGIPVRSGVDWVKSEDSDVIHPMNRLGSPEETATYCALSNGERGSHWAPGVFTRMAIASCAALALQWGTAGAALIVAYFTPTTVGFLSCGMWSRWLINTENRVSINELPHVCIPVNFSLDDVPFVQYPCALLCGLFSSNFRVTVCPHCSSIFSWAATDGQIIGHRKLHRGHLGKCVPVLQLLR